jgi:hypothetical protein
MKTAKEIFELETRTITEKEVVALKHFTRLRKVTFWGSDSMVRPVLIVTVFGDGKKLMWFQMVNNRPLFYLALVDSKTPLESNSNDDIDTFFEKYFGVFPDVIYEAIENQWGNVDDMQNGSYGEKGDTPCNKYNKSKDEDPCSSCSKLYCCEWTKWPALNCDCGCCWGEEASVKEISKLFNV